MLRGCQVENRYLPAFCQSKHSSLLVSSFRSITSGDSIINKRQFCKIAVLLPCYDKAGWLIHVFTKKNRGRWSQQVSLKMVVDFACSGKPNRSRLCTPLCYFIKIIERDSSVFKPFCIIPSVVCKGNDCFYCPAALSGSLVKNIINLSITFR